MRLLVRALSFLSLAGLITSGCQCRGRSGLGQKLGEIGVVWVDANGSQHVNRDATYDFGPAFLEETLTKQMVVRNLGNAPLRLTLLEQKEGARVSIGSDVKPDAYFAVKFSPVITIDASAEAVIDMSFTPHVGIKRPTTKLLLTAEGTRADENTAIITLMGEGEGANCDVPPVLDFGDVPTGENFKLDIKLENGASVEAKANVGNVTGADATSFQVTPTGDLTIGKQSQQLINVSFVPSENRDYQAKTIIKAGADCPPHEVTLKGKGVTQVLSWKPEKLDFGFVSPTVSAPRELTFTNTSNVPIKLTKVKTNFLDFIYDAPAGETEDTFTVAGGGTSKLTVICRPSSFGPRRPSETEGALLTFETGLKAQPSGVVTLNCIGGGPRIRVTPRPTLNFGKVGYFPNNTNYAVSRKVTVQNIGTRPRDEDLDGGVANLYLGPTPRNLPLIDLNVTGSNTQAGEFDVAPQGYSLDNGIPAEVGKNTADLVVFLTPKSLGTKEADLTIFSNDSLEPSIVVKLTADVQPQAPCNLFVAPTTLDFGLVTPPSFSDLPITLKNLGSNPNEVCVLTGLEIAAGSDAAFSIVGGNIDEKVLMPGETATLKVRAWPMGQVPAQPTRLNGRLVWNMADPVNPQRIVNLQATVGPSCLTFAPESYNFGTVKKGCNTSTREFNVYNTCAGTVYVQEISMPYVAGQPPNGANCAGANPCPEFFMTAAPTIPKGGLALNPGDSTKFSVRYRPIDDGDDTGAVQVKAIHDGNPATYLLSLSGSGDDIGRNADTFSQLERKADVLLVIDNSGSMEDKQNSLSVNFDSFIQYAKSVSVDWQIGVTTTWVDDRFGSSAENGRLIGDDPRTNPNGNPKILTPTTVNVANKFKDKVKVGIWGGGGEMHFEAAVRALSPPLITKENLGFLRYDANLAVVVVTDAGDQSPDTYARYLDRLRSIKGYQRVNMFTFNLIGPLAPQPPSGCSYDLAHDASSMVNAVTATAGVKAEVCTPDWATKLKEIGKTAFGYRTVFYLTSEPDLTNGKTLEVKIDGNVVPTTSYTYKPATMSVEFTPTTTPQPGQKLTVSYLRACL